MLAVCIALRKAECLHSSVCEGVCTCMRFAVQGTLSQSALRCMQRWLQPCADYRPIIAASESLEIAEMHGCLQNGTVGEADALDDSRDGQQPQPELGIIGIAVVNGAALLAVAGIATFAAAKKLPRFRFW